MDVEVSSYLWDRINHAYRLMHVQGGDGDELDHCLIVDLWTGTACLIEDNARCRALKERMQAEGVPIIRPGDCVTVSVPPLQAISDEFLSGRITMEECNQRRRALANDPVARRAWIVENGLDR
jgi:hypothetical protein